MNEKYGSRKFIVTVSGMVFTLILAALGAMDTHAAFVFSAGIASYNYANTKESESA